MTLDEKKIQEFKNKLVHMRARLLGQFNEITQAVKEPEESKGYAQHQADEGSDEYEKALELQLSSQELDVIRQIDRALEKIEEGTYGICDITKQNIPLKRLEAVPYATMTVKAQEELEKKYEK